ncbi:MAG: right-handed parallel beta-helix repeat-containing protein [bacterium]|nr:right-handed parallel beta-helix repeat-containing protein [bacterium]
MRMRHFLINLCCRLSAIVVVGGVVTQLGRGAELIVAKSGGMYASIQAALDAAQPGDTVTVRVGTYDERLIFPRSGNSTNGPIVVRAFPGERVILNGRNQSSSSRPHMILGYHVSYVEVHGFHICSNRASATYGGSGIMFEGGGPHLRIISNTIYWIRGTHGMGITIYGTTAVPYSNIVIAYNMIRDCEPATSEALTLNGNVVDFWIISNYVHDVNNIGICMIGGESDIHPTRGARHGVCVGNRVVRARSSYGGGYAAGIYSDGAQNVVLERNVVTECDIGMELGAENAGWLSSNVIARNNLLYLNDKIGLAIGGYDRERGRVIHCQIMNNTLARNNIRGLGANDFHGEIVISYAASNRFENNLIIVSEQGDRRALYDIAEGNVHNRLNYNLYHANAAPGTVMYYWNGAAYQGFVAYTNATETGDRNSLYADPQCVAPAAGDFRLRETSPAVDRGNPAYLPDAGVLDLDGVARVYGGCVDIGAYEFVPEPLNGLVVVFGELVRRRRNLL